MEAMRIVTIGGGTGQFGVLRALCLIQDKLRASGRGLAITAIPSTMDSGGASGVLRLNHHIIAVGDIGQCILALCEDPARDAWLFDGARFFSAGNIKSTLRNYVVSQALLYYGNDGAAAMRAIRTTFHLRGTIAPVAFSEDTHVKALLGDGTELTSEDEIYRADLTAAGGIKRLWLDPIPEPNPEALQAIAGADAIIVCPGTLACSILPNFRVPGVIEALQKSPARKRICLPNLMKEHRRAPADWTVRDYVEGLEGELGRGFFDTVVCNNAAPSPAQSRAYADESVLLPEASDLREGERTLIATPLLAQKAAEKNPGDALAGLRSTVRHDPELTAWALLRALDLFEVL